MLKGIHHIGVIVDDLESAKRFLGGTLNLSLQRELDSPERAMRAAFFRCAEVDIEVIEMTEPEARRKRLGDTQARIDHIAIEVDDLVKSLAALGEVGVHTASGPTRI